MPMTNREAFRKGFKAGIPIGLGYFAVAFSLGIAAKAVGLNAIQGFIASALNIASAGEYALFTLIGASATIVELILVTLVANGRYILMSCALGQKLSPELSLGHRFGVGFFITDEIFSLCVSQDGYLNPFVSYGAASFSVPMWALGTSMGIIAGEILPLRVVSALSVALFGMFIASFIPPTRKNRVLLFSIPCCFVISYIASKMPWVGELSEGSRSVLLTIIIASVLAFAFPVKDDAETSGCESEEVSK